MKKATLFLAVILGVLGVMAGCGKQADTPNTSDPSTSPPSTEVSEASKASKDTLDKLADLLGKEDVDVVAALGEGTANQLDGTTDTVGRTYELDLFGEKVTVSVNYDDGKKVSNSYIYLSDQDLDFYRNQRRHRAGNGTYCTLIHAKGHGNAGDHTRRRHPKFSGGQLFQYFSHPFPLSHSQSGSWFTAVS